MNIIRNIGDESPAGESITFPTGISGIVVVEVEVVVVLVVEVEVVLVEVLDVVDVMLVLVEVVEVTEFVVEVEDVVVLVEATVGLTSISRYFWGGLYPRALILSL